MKIFGKIISALLAAVMALSLVACGEKKDDSGNDNKNDDISKMSCEQVIEYVYANCGEVKFFKNLETSGNSLVNKSIQADGGSDYYGCSYYFGTSIEFSSAVASEPDMQPPAYSFCVAVMPDGTDMAAIKKTVEEKADPMKWVCTGVGTVYVETVDNTLALIMADEDTAKALRTAFLTLKAGEAKPSDTSTTPAVTDKPSEVTKESLLAIIKQIYSGAQGKCTRVDSYFGEYKDESFYEDGISAGKSAYWSVDVDFETAVLSASAMSPDPYMMCLIKPKTDADVETLKKTLTDNALLNWQVCVIADKVIVVDNGGYVLMIMGTADETKSLSDAFLALSLS